MRIAGFLALVLFLPAFAHAADAPTLTTYTISHDTIYPAATTESGLATTTTIDIAFSEQVKASIKILSASGVLVKTLYSSSSVTNPTPKIWDGTDAGGAPSTAGSYTILISATSTATNLVLSDSSKTVTIAMPETDEDPIVISEETGTPTAASPDGGPPAYIPIPALRIIADGNRTVSSGADTAFSASVYDNKGNRRDDATVSWSFGDGMRRAGASVFHRYYEPGEYLAVVRAITSDGGDARVEAVITVKNAGIRIASASARGITLANDDSRTLDLSLWRLSAGGQEFKIPEDTRVLAGRTILFPAQVTGLAATSSASLLYPSGEAAAAYSASAPAPVVRQTAAAPASSEQPPIAAAGYQKVQAVEPLAVSKVEPVINTTTNVQAHAQAVNAPAAATELAAAGAASPAPALFKSPWILGLLGIVVTAAGAFILI